jgi:hypothetical protein
LKPNILKVITWLVLAIFGAILVTACQPAARSTAVESPLTIKTEPLSTRPPPQPTETIVETTELIAEPTEPSKVATHTPPVSSAPKSGFPVCDSLQDGVPSPATPSPQAGISVEMDSMFSPAPPAKVEVIYSEAGVLLTWGSTGTDVDQFYKVYRSKEGDECWQLIGIKPIEGDNKGGYEFEAIITVQTETYIYAITTVDIYGNESDLSMADILGSGS